MKEQFAAPKVQAAGTVRVTLPAKVAYDPAALKKGISNLMERIGCPKCFSGADCIFQMERNFVLEGSARAVDPGAAVALASPEAKSFSVGLSSGVRYNIDKVFKAVDKVIDLIGPHPCISGFDIFFKDELRTIVVNEKLEGQRFDAAVF